MAGCDDAEVARHRLKHMRVGRASTLAGAVFAMSQAGLVSGFVPAVSVRGKSGGRALFVEMSVLLAASCVCFTSRES